MSRPTSSRSSPAASTADVRILDPPKASVSAVVFSPTPAAPEASSSNASTDVLVSSWDNHVHHYRIDVSPASAQEDGANKVQTFPHEAPVLDVCFVNDHIAASASVDRRVRMLDLRTGKSLIVGKHNDMVLKIRFCPQTQLLISGSADRTLSFWAVGLSASGDVEPSKTGLLKSLTMPDKVIALDVSPPFVATGESTPIHSASNPSKPHARDSTPRLVVGMTGRHVYVYDLVPLRKAIDRHVQGQHVAERDWEPDQKRESSLKFMARDLRCMPAGDGYATSSIEGRIAVEFFDPSPKVQAMKYAFKCHRETVSEDMNTQDDKDDLEKPYDVVYPVHAVVFHPRHGTFASLGGDAVISVWDAGAKKRIRQYPKLSNAVTAGSFDASGKLLLVATGNDATTAGAANDAGVELILKRNAWDECRPKPKSSSSAGSKSSSKK